VADEQIGPDLIKGTHCFCCGRDNPQGLHLEGWVVEGQTIHYDFVAEARFQGWEGILHGEVLPLVFDEMLGWLSYRLGHRAMTARLEVRLRKPVAIGERLRLTGTLAQQPRTLLEVALAAARPDGTVVADGVGTLLILGR
jgi:hypothetical protein